MQRGQGRWAPKYVGLDWDICNFTSWHASFALLARSFVDDLRLQSCLDPFWGSLPWVRVRGFIKYSPSCMVEAVDAPQTRFRAPNPWFRVKARSRSSIPDQVDYWEGVLHLLFNKLCLKMIDHGSRSTWDPGPSRSRLGSQKYDPLPLKQSFPTTFVL